MAWKTSHRIRLLKEVKPEIQCLIEEYMMENEEISWVTYGELNEWGDEDRSFTDSDKNMYKLSKEFPNIVFVLESEPIDGYELGEYTEYWQNGYVQEETASISVDKFDTVKLKKPKFDI